MPKARRLRRRQNRPALTAEICAGSVQRQVGPVLIVVGLVLAQDRSSWSWFRIRVRFRSSRRHPPIQRSAIAFMRGVRTLQKRSGFRGRPGPRRMQRLSSIPVADHERQCCIGRSLLSRSALIGMTDCQMAITSWPDTVRTRWRAGTPAASCKGRSGCSTPAASSPDPSEPSGKTCSAPVAEFWHSTGRRAARPSVSPAPTQPAPVAPGQRSPKTIAHHDPGTATIYCRYASLETTTCRIRNQPTATLQLAVAI